MIQRLFPLGLYATLLAACCALVLPGLAAPVERVMLGATTLPLRVHGVFTGRPAMAATAEPLPRVVSAGERLAGSLQREALAGSRPLVQQGLRPVVCRVVDHEHSSTRSGARVHALWIDRDPGTCGVACRG